MNRPAMPPRLPFSALAALALTLSGCGGPGEEPPLAGATIGGPFTLVDKAGKPVRYADTDGKWRMVYFGYSFCPDVCPLDLQRMMQGYHSFAKDHAGLAADVVPIFITVDPERDTPAKIGEYTANFGPELVGLTGTPEQVKAAESAWKVYASKREGTTPGSYLMDHSRGAYLMDRAGKPVALLPVDASGQAVAAELAKWVH